MNPNPLNLRNALSLPLLLGLTATAHALPITPQYDGIYQNGDGANSTWVQVIDDWRGDLYGDQSWGTGLWGLGDHAQVMGLADNDPFVVQTLTARVDQINFADQRFIDEWGASWSTPLLAPIFNNTPEENQDNWVSSFWGYIAITTPGAYNFSVLFDDGFRFSLFGSGENSLSILRDGLNPRERLGFPEDLQLSTGLYGFQLDAYERLEAGAVQLAWYTPGADDWALVPQPHLFTSPIPEPSVPLLMLAGLAAFGLTIRRRRS
ncbi:MAG: PEP-CTERM sorting domain-containing protein [Thiobacillus sp.]|nr:PEP-CTERM sorting domain-containing protein [Thiobacillus sp.]MDO9387439.1 PEP-CTERM sorting domain-containing protein [Thiobacillus sp.]